MKNLKSDLWQILFSPLKARTHLRNDNHRDHHGNYDDYVDDNQDNDIDDDDDDDNYDYDDDDDDNDNDDDDDDDDVDDDDDDVTSQPSSTSSLLKSGSK